MFSPKSHLVPVYRRALIYRFGLLILPPIFLISTLSAFSSHFPYFDGKHMDICCIIPGIFGGCKK